MRDALLTVLAMFGFWAPVSPPPGNIRFEGNDSFSGAQLLAILRNRYVVPLEGNFGVTDADDAAYFLRTFYFSRGYRDATITYTFTPGAPPSALFVINEGAQRQLGAVTFTGGGGIPPERQRDIFNAAVRQATLRPFGQIRYVESAVEAGRAALVNAYAHEGYLDAVVTSESSPAARPDFVDVHLTIAEGTRYLIRAITFAGAPVDDETLRGVVKSFVDRPYERNQDALIPNRIADWLRNHGYLEADVAATTTRETATGAVTVHVDIAAGRIYRLGRITVEGLSRTRERAVLERLALPPGEPYDASEVDAAGRRLWFTGAFREVDIQRVPRPDGTVDLVIKAEETRARRLQFGVGYSQWDRGFLRLGYVDRNVLGSLNRLNVDGYLSQRTYGIAASLTDPWIFRSDFEGTVGLSYAHRELPAYRANEFSGTVGLVRRLDQTNLSGYRLQYGYKRVTDGVVFGDEEEVPDPNYSLGSITWGQTYDTRNNILSPMRGLYLNYEVELANPALLGDLAFLRTSAQATYYQPLRAITPERPFVPFVVVNHRVGALFPYGNSRDATIPVPERFFLGGPDTVRSFQLDGLGPRDSDGDPLGGLAMLLVNLEIQWPVFNNIYVAAFADAGNLWSTVEDVQPLDLQLGVGPGLRVYTPLGAVRIDYGYNVNRQEGDPIGAWQVGFGFTF